MERECEYRKCKNDITEMRKDAKFCCRNCKDMERTYIKRKKMLIEKYKKSEMIKVEGYKRLKDIILKGEQTI